MPTILSVEVANPHYIRFPMDDCGKRVTVHIATSWLKQRAERDQRNVSNLALLYQFYRDEIEAAASARSGAGSTEPRYGHAVTGGREGIHQAR